MSKEDQTILLVDDDEEMLHNLISLFSSLTKNIHKASTAADAIRLARKLVPNVIVLDLDLDHDSGYDVLSLIRRYPDLSVCPVIVLSGYPASKELVKCLENGADDYIEKPFSKNILISKVQNQLNIKRVQNAIVDKQRTIQISKYLEDGIFEMDDSFQILWANPKAKHLMSLSDCCTGVNIRDLFENLHVRIKEGQSLNLLKEIDTQSRVIAWIPRDGNQDEGLYSFFCISKKQGFKCSTYLIQVSSLSKKLENHISIFLFEHFIAHKFNTPMNQILLPLQMIQEDQSLNHESRDLLDTAILAANELHRKHNNIFEFINIQRIKSFAVDQLTLSQLEHCIHEYYMRSSIVFDFKLQSHDDSIHFKCNKTLINIILDELASNTKRFCRLSTPQHTIFLTIYSQDHVALTISDNGDQSTPSISDKLLIPFEQIDRFDFNSEIGLGLGLSKLRFLLWYVNGDIHLQNEPDTGGFSVKLLFSIVRYPDA